MEPFNEILPQFNEDADIITEITLLTDWQAWKDAPPDTDYRLILEAEQQ